MLARKLPCLADFIAKSGQTVQLFRNLLLPGVSAREGKSQSQLELDYPVKVPTQRPLDFDV